MANYIKQSLEEGETIIFKGRLHWSYIFRYLFFSLLFVLGGATCIFLAYYRQPEKQQTLFYVGIALLVLAFIIWIVGRIVRTRSEFAVTDTRFVQKDGIFNIKMTEIPLARIETVAKDSRHRMRRDGGQRRHVASSALHRAAHESAQDHLRLHQEAPAY